MTHAHPSPTTSGLHHVSVLARDPRDNLAFWTGTMGQRLIKRTVNFDAPSMYHLYYGDGAGSIGTALTFFPIPNAAANLIGTGETSAVAYAVAPESLDFWTDRLTALDRSPTPFTRWQRNGIAFDDPDGLRIELIAVDDPPDVEGWPGEPVAAADRLHGFESVTLRLARAGATIELLERVGYAVEDECAEGSARRLRLTTSAPALGNAVDIVEEGRSRPRRDGRGSVHHIAFRLSGDEEQLALRDDLLALGLSVSDVRERDYFRSIYVREPGGVLFEFATDGPGFDIDEPREALGSSLRLPAWAEPQRAEIERRLPSLDPISHPRRNTGIPSDGSAAKEART